jgi:hypothetical protein
MRLQRRAAGTCAEGAWIVPAAAVVGTAASQAGAQSVLPKVETAVAAESTPPTPSDVVAPPPGKGDEKAAHSGEGTEGEGVVETDTPTPYQQEETMWKGSAAEEGSAAATGAEGMLGERRQPGPEWRTTRPCLRPGWRVGPQRPPAAAAAVVAGTPGWHAAAGTGAVAVGRTGSEWPVRTWAGEGSSLVPGWRRSSWAVSLGQEGEDSTRPLYERWTCSQVWRGVVEASGYCVMVTARSDVVRVS